MKARKAVLRRVGPKVVPGRRELKPFIPESAKLEQKTCDRNQAQSVREENECESSSLVVRAAVLGGSVLQCGGQPSYDWAIS